MHLKCFIHWLFVYSLKKQQQQQQKNTFLAQEG